MRKASKGFTIMETMVAIGILTLMITISIPSYRSIRDNVVLDNDSYEIVNALRLAQSRSIVSQGGTTHGVYFATSTYTLFDGEWATPANTVEYSLKRGIKIYAGVDYQVVFNRLTGKTASTTIIVGTSDTKKKIIQIGKSGAITIN